MLGVAGKLARGLDDGALCHGDMQAGLGQIVHDTTFGQVALERCGDDLGRECQGQDGSQ